MDGVLPLYKDRGMTSFDCIRRLRQVLNTKKIGHSGTLDPDVSGVLPICLGRATKLVPYLMASGKEYAGELLIGYSTTTEDLSGETLEKRPVKEALSDDEIQAAMQDMTGKLTQIPPMYSAVKVNGKRLYEYARAGEKVERPKREVTINTFTMTANNYDPVKQEQRVRFRVTCSKGTYIRTLVVDLAKKLGYAGTMSSLTRLASGGFELDQTLSLQDVEDAVNDRLIQNYVYPLTYVLRKYPQISLTDAQWPIVKNGGWLKASDLAIKDEKQLVLNYHDDVQAIYRLDNQGHYRPEKMLLKE